jgi:transcriptional regulator with XRE-family HTH domain
VARVNAKYCGMEPSAPLAADDIGGRLRQAREHRDLSLSDLARRTKLPILVLAAIERNDFARLPGGLFRKAYVRTVAIELGLNPTEIAAAYRARFEPSIEPPPALHDAARQAEWIEQLAPSPRRSIATLLMVAIPAAAWFMLQSDPELPNVRAHDVGEDVLEVRMPVNVVTPIASDARTPEVPLRIEMVADGWCWVAAEADGQRVLYRLVEPGEHLVFEGQRLISLRLGNAGGVTLSINGGASQSLGGDGEVVEFELTPDTVEALRNGAVETLTEA